MTRPAVSLSMSGWCRAKIWYAAHGYEQEEIRPGTQRTFDIGHVVEELMLRGIWLDPEGVNAGPDDVGAERLAPWWNSLGEVTDHSTGKVYDTAKMVAYEFQKELEIDGFVGHIDALVGPDPLFILDVKTMPGMTFARYLKGDLMADPFARQYVMQLQAYMHGYLVGDAALLLFNKENSQVAFRFIKYDPALAAEARERLAWAKSDIMPTPDWAWPPAPFPLPIVCSYCPYKAPCAESRGKKLEMTTEKGKPVWVAR